MTVAERFDAAQRILLTFDKIKEKYDENKKARTEIDQCFLLLQTIDEEKKDELFLELKRLMVKKLDCKPEWFEEDFLRQIQEAHAEKIKKREEAEKRAELAPPPSKKKYLN